MLSQQMTDEKFFEIMAQVYNIKLDEADEWDFINAAREDRALVFNDRSQLDALKAENARLRDALKFAQIKLSLIDDKRIFEPSDWFTISDVLLVLNSESLQPQEQQS